MLRESDQLLGSRSLRGSCFCHDFSSGCLGGRDIRNWNFGSGSGLGCRGSKSLLGNRRKDAGQTGAWLVERTHQLGGWTE